MRWRTLLVLCALVALTVGVATATGSGNPGGNSANAKKCYKGGWQTLVDANGNPFANQDACVSYGAKGGVLYPSSAGPCLGTGYQMKATANGDPFASAAACAAYLAANPGQLVSCTRVGTSGNDDLGLVGSDEVVCGFGGNDIAGNLLNGAVFYGGPGDDFINFVGPGGTFNGGAGDDTLGELSGGTFDGGADTDAICLYLSGSHPNVENIDTGPGCIP